MTNQFDRLPYDLVDTIIFDSRFWKITILYKNGDITIATPPTPDDFFEFQDSAERKMAGKKKKR